MRVTIVQEDAVHPFEKRSRRNEVVVISDHNPIDQEFDVYKPICNSRIDDCESEVHVAEAASPHRLADEPDVGLAKHLSDLR